MSLQDNARPPHGEPGEDNADAIPADTHKTTTTTPATPTTIAEVGHKLIENGYLPIAIRYGEKRPEDAGWQRQRLTVAECARYPRSGVGVLTGQGEAPLVALDIDTTHGPLAEAFENWCLDHIGLAPVRIGQAPKRLLVYRAEVAGLRKHRSRQYRHGEDDRLHHLETLGDGQQFVAYGVHPSTRQPYQWTDILGGLAEWGADTLTVITEAQVLEAIAQFQHMAEGKPYKLRPVLTPRTGALVVPGHDDPFAGADPGPTDDTPEQIVEMLDALDAEDYEQWNRVGMALYHQFEGDVAGLEIWDDWSSKASNYADLDDLEYRWEGFAVGQGINPTTLRTVKMYAAEAEKEATRLATGEARRVLAEAIAKCDDADELLTKEASDAGFLSRESPALRIEMEGLIQNRFKKLTGRKPPIGDVRRAMEAGTESLKSDGHLVLDPADPMGTAREFLSQREGRMVRVQGAFYGWGIRGYRPVDQEALEGELWPFMSSATTPSGESFKPTRNIVADAVAALRSVARADVNGMSGWVNGRTEPAPGDLVVFQNGILHLLTMELMPLDPDYFTTSVLPFDHNPNASAPAWDKFINSLWPNDPECQALLREIMGYLVAGGTDQQKLFLMIGAPRAGKGVIVRIIAALVGPGGACAPTLASLATNFGLAPLIGKRVAIIGDARLSGRANQAAIASALLGISGEDSLTIDRKHIAPWTGRLDTRIVIVTNELPRIGDASGALARRFVILPFTQTFYGREDTGLTDRLMAELPGIFNWCLAGLTPLRERGHFQPVAAATGLAADLMGLTSPITRFIGGVCEVGDGHTVVIADLYHAWRCWCSEHGHQPGTDGTFGRDLKAALPTLTKVRPRLPDGTRPPQYSGIRLIHAVEGESS